MNKRILIPFSGGIDSTYLMWKNLMNKNYVKPVYFSLTNNEQSQKAEKMAMKQIMDILREDFDHYIINDVKEITQFSLNAIGEDHQLELPQPPIWILGLMFTDLNWAHEVHMGYVMGDDLVSYTDEVISLYEKSCRFGNFERWERNPPELKFPLKHVSKREIWDKLPERLRQICISCERPIIRGDVAQSIEDCGRCSSCERNKHENIFYKMKRNHGGFDESSIKALIQDLKDIQHDISDEESTLNALTRFRRKYKKICKERKDEKS